MNSVTGDVQILTSAINELEISDYKKTSLKRHLWRPKRFMRLLDLYSKQKKNGRNIRSFKITNFSPWKEKLLESKSFYGVRTKTDIKERIEITMVVAIILVKCNSLGRSNDHFDTL